MIFSAVLVIGRNHHLKPGELERLAWRKANVVVASQKIECVTFDELAEDLESWLTTILADPKANR